MNCAGVVCYLCLMETPPERIETARLLLRRWTVDDAKVLVDAANASLDHLRPWMAWATHVRSPAEQREWLEHMTAKAREGSDFGYGAFRASDPTRVIGGCGLHRRIGAGGIEIGYWIHVDAIGHGYATELAGALTRVALQLTDIDRVEIHCDEANVRSAAVPHKLGYVLDRIENNTVEAPGEAGRSMIWVMRAADAAQTSDRPVAHRCVQDRQRTPLTGSVMGSPPASISDGNRDGKRREHSGDDAPADRITR